MASEVTFTTIRLGDVCEKIGSGATPRGGRDVYLSDGISLIRSQNVYNDRFWQEGLAYIGDDHAEELANVKVHAGDVLLNITGDSVARCCQAPSNVLPARVNQHVAIIRPDKRRLNARFLMYYLVSPLMQQYMLALAGAGATRNALTKGMIEDFQIFTPPLTIQKAIAHILGSLDDKIELNSKMNETLETMARAIFKSWFVDFNPIRAKAEGRDTGLPKEIAALFPDSFEGSELGEIPKGWRVEPLSEFTTVITKGTTPTQDEIESAPEGDTQINYVRVNAIEDDGAILFDKLTAIPESVHLGVLKRSILRANDVLYTIAGTIGRISIVEESLLPANTNQAVAILRPKPTIPANFLVLTMRQAAFREELHSNIVHAVQANLSLGMLSRARGTVPPKNMLLQLFKPIDDLVKLIGANRTESRTLATIRDALLPKLISGELRVKNAEKVVKAV